ncbi:MAG: UDP-glucose/GDP-mannose dehydrogenase family protein [Bacteroidales bacterium]|nr:UDP-glucose/GDP-mannose dehydrogenase family protein [Bacteroidales bacterium]MDZ4204718.1 UDP-glucose/GDP-mannose dehydrogenase family protein [Bacteroidales bacterium]
MKIIIVGSGYVGLVTGTCFAEVGIDVVCVDIDAEKIEKLRNGISPIYEPGLDEMIGRNVAKGRLHFETDLACCLNDADVIFSAVGTPPDEDGSADLKYVLDVARTVGKHMGKHLILVTKSTVPVGTANKVRQAMQEVLDQRGSALTFDVVSNPEFLKEGAAIDDFMRPDRIVVGVETEHAREVMAKLYKPFTLNGHPIIFMDVPSAEMTKYAANGMLATKISFMNDIANLCELVGADVNMVRKGIGSDSRIGHKFIYPGIGYGGSCFPKDVKALIKTAELNKYSLRVLKAVEEVNESQKSVLFNKVNRYFKGDLKGRTFCLWGLSFKPQTDDMREAPSLVIVEKLLAAGCKVKAYDPVAMHEAKHRLGDAIEYATDAYDALVDADALLLITEWTEFRFPNLTVMKKLLKSPVVFDGRNIYDSVEMENAGFDYFSIGRKSNI